MPLHALDTAQYCSGLRWAHCFHEPWLVAGLPSVRRQCERGRSGLWGVPPVSWPLQPLPSYRKPGCRGELRALCWDIWRSGQWLLAGCDVVSGSRDVGAWRSGLYLHLQPVLPEHPEEEFIQHLWTAPGYCRWDILHICVCVCITVRKSIPVSRSSTQEISFTTQETWEENMETSNKKHSAHCTYS